MDALDLIRRLHEHRAWANARLLGATRALTDQQLRQRFDIGQGSAWATLVHLYGAELVWLDAVLGRPDTPLPDPEGVESLEHLAVAWAALERRWARYLADLRPASLTTPVLRHPTPAPGSPAPQAPALRTPLADVLLHVAAHAQYTAAQLTHILRRLGVAPPPDVMLITLSRTQHNPPA